MGLINDENYINVQGWMVNKLHLKGNELLVYAVIYGYSQGKNGKFEGSLQYLADWCGATKQGILKNINSLLQKELIKKEVVSVNGLNYVKYYTTEIREIPLNKVERGIKQSLTPIKQSLTPIKQSLTNNIVNNIDNKQEDITINSNIHNSEDTKQFLNNKPKQKKPNLYTKIVDLINEYTNNEYLRKLLIAYWNICKSKAKQKNKDFFYGHFSGKLDILSELSNGDTDSQIVIVEYSVKNKYSTLYPVHKNNNSNKSMKTVNGKFQDNMEPDRRDTTGKEFEEVNEGF